MEQDKALSILKTLADGIDPATGEQFPAGSPYQHPDTVRALFWAVQTLSGPVRAQKRRATARGNSPTMPASPGRRKKTRSWARPSMPARPIEQLAEEHKRSRIAIEARLVKLGKISDAAKRNHALSRSRDAAAQPRAA